MISALLKRVRERGVRGTLTFAFELAVDRALTWIDGGFDRRSGTDTSGHADDMAALGIPFERRGPVAVGYEPIQIPVFGRIMKEIAGLGFAPRGFTFVDFGSGKGRAAMMAAEQRFAAVHGVEISPVLHAIAERNAGLFRARNPEASPLTFRCQDAADFEIPPGDLLCFLYNPFTADVLAAVLRNLDAACRREPRRLVIVYRNPQHAVVFDGYLQFRLARNHRDYKIYAAA